MALRNSIRLIGHCGSDPILKRYGENKHMLIVPVYTEHWFSMIQEDSAKKHTEIHRCVFFGANAERANTLLMKGTEVHILGVMHYRKVKSEDRVVIYPQVIVEDFTLASRAIMTKELYEHIFKD
jgi:single-strand DNA-binding protein